MTLFASLLASRISPLSSGPREPRPSNIPVYPSGTDATTISFPGLEVVLVAVKAVAPMEKTSIGAVPEFK